VGDAAGGNQLIGGKAQFRLNMKIQNLWIWAILAFTLIASLPDDIFAAQTTVGTATIAMCDSAIGQFLVSADDPDEATSRMRESAQEECPARINPILALDCSLAPPLECPDVTLGVESAPHPETKTLTVALPLGKRAPPAAQ
jgi:hypothetical protein